VARAALHLYKIPAPKLRVRKQLQPDSVRLHYFSSLRAFMAKAHSLVTRDLLPLVHDLLPSKTDATDEERVKSTLDGLSREFARYMPPRKLRDLSEEVFKRTEQFQRDQLFGQIKSALGFDPLILDQGLTAKAETFVEDNVDLVKTIPERYFSSLEDVVLEGVREGRRADAVARDIEDRYGVSESDAARIANDQVGKLYGDLNKDRQTDLGITKFTWATAQDVRVRDSHAELEGQEFDWDDPPEVDGEKIIPGQAISCRCDALPVLEDLLG
jgi:SPP1 gp7 family putative phage head morphogenesis protein